MFKAVRVILSLLPGQFLSGLARSQSAFGGFMGFLKSGISTGHMLFTGLNQAVQLVGSAIRFVTNMVKDLTDQFLSGAIAQERFQTQLTAMLGDSELANQIMGSLDERILKYGMDAESAYGATIQFTMGLKGMDGAVDPDKLEMLLNMMQRIKTLRPDIVGGEQAISRGIITALQGDFSTLTRLLDIPLNKLQGLSAEAQAFLNKTGSATDQQLGQVTALAGQTQGNAENAIAVLDELLNAAGITQEVVDEVQETTDARLDQVTARWEDFKKQVGEQILPILNDKLGEFIDFLDEHQEEIDAFAEALGKLAAEGFENLANKLLEIDWKKVGADAKDFAEDIRYIVEQIAEFLKKLEELSEWGGWDLIMGEGGFAGPQEFMNRQGEQGRQGWNLQEALGLDANMPLFQAIAQRNNNNQEAAQQTPSQGPQEVTVRVVVDDDMNIGARVERVARRAATEEIGAFTDEVTRSTGAGH